MAQQIVTCPQCSTSLKLNITPGRRSVVCPKCRTCCEFNVECGKEEKSCWLVECEQICVPRVVFPWQTRKARCRSQAGCCSACSHGCGTCTCVNNGARVRTVKKLKKHKYECPKCEYEWTPRTICGGGCYAGGAGCVEVPDQPHAELHTRRQTPELETAQSPPQPGSVSLGR